MNENTTLKEFERNAKNCKHQMDRLTRAYYGMTFDEMMKAVSADQNRTSMLRNTMEGGDWDDKQ